jgi:hypothetical protein
MRLGDHLPHPALTMRRAAAHEFSFADAPQRVTIDGRQYGRAGRVGIDVLADAFVLCVAPR